eukprot:ctg_281.g165
MISHPPLSGGLLHALQRLRDRVQAVVADAVQGGHVLLEQAHAVSLRRRKAHQRRLGGFGRLFQNVLLALEHVGLGFAELGLGGGHGGAHVGHLLLGRVGALLVVHHRAPRVIVLGQALHARRARLAVGHLLLELLQQRHEFAGRRGRFAGVQRLELAAHLLRRRVQRRRHFLHVLTLHLLRVRLRVGAERDVLLAEAHPRVLRLLQVADELAELVVQRDDLLLVGVVLGHRRALILLQRALHTKARERHGERGVLGEGTRSGTHRNPRTEKDTRGCGDRATDCCTCTFASALQVLPLHCRPLPSDRSILFIYPHVCIAPALTTDSCPAAGHPEDAQHAKLQQAAGNVGHARVVARVVHVEADVHLAGCSCRLRVDLLDQHGAGGEVDVVLARLVQRGDRRVDARQVAGGVHGQRVFVVDKVAEGEVGEQRGGIHHLEIGHVIVRVHGGLVDAGTEGDLAAHPKIVRLCVVAVLHVGAGDHHRGRAVLVVDGWVRQQRRRRQEVAVGGLVGILTIDGRQIPGAHLHDGRGGLHADK